jgi:hypothetical protein
MMKLRQGSKRFVICVRNTDCEDLAIRKVYQVLPDAKAEAVGLVRVVDESGEDYLYQADCFLPIELPQSIERALAAVA